MAPIPVPPPSDPDEAGMMPDLSHLSEEERKIILQVLQRQKAEEQKEEEIAQKGDRELWDIEKQIQERKENAQRLIGTQDDAICQICQKTKFADGIGHKCFYCQLRSCARCGGRTTSKSKNFWACMLCQKRQQILARTGKWFRQDQQQPAAASAQQQQLEAEQMSTTPSPVGQQRRQSLQSTMTGAAAAVSATTMQPSGGLSRQGTLHRQRSLEDHGGSGASSSMHMNGTIATGADHRVASGVEQSSPNTLEQQPRQNGQIRIKDAGGQQQSQQQQRNSSSRQAAHKQQPQPLLNSHPASSPSISPAEDHHHHQKTQPHERLQHQRSTGDTTTSNRIRPTTTTATERQPSMEEARMGERTTGGTSPAATAQPAASVNDHQRRLAATTTVVSSSSSSAAAAAIPFVPAVQGQSSSHPSAAAGNAVRRQSIGVSAPAPATTTTTTSTTSIGGPSPMRIRRTKLANNNHHHHRQQQHQQQHQQQQHMRSYSSSDDELSSPKQQQPSVHLTAGKSGGAGGGGTIIGPAAATANGAAEQLAASLEAASNKLEPDFSEKELLRYIYDNAHPNARRAAAAAATKGRGGPFFGRQQSHSSLDAPSAASLSAMSLPPQQPTASTGTVNLALARRIRNYLSNPAVSWQPSADQRRLIGHIVLYKPSALASVVPNSLSTSAGFSPSLDFGVKVVGGRNPSTGRFGAFVSRIRPGSVADTVGQLRAGDEVLEWNGHSLQNITPESVYNIVQSTKSDSRLELIVSRPLTAGDDDFLNIRQLARRDHYQQQQQQLAGGTHLPHSQSLIASSSPYTAAPPSAAPIYPFNRHQHYSQQQQQYSKRAPSPLVLHAAGPGIYYDSMASAGHVPYPAPAFTAADASSSSAGGGVDPRICGRLEMALLYLAQKQQLIISLSRAYDLLARSDGAARNPYLKLFLLPDRSERSRRQSKVLTDTLFPVWDEHFFYEDLDENRLAGRVLEVTLWDFDPYESHTFLGETLVELAQAPLNNQPFVYNLLDMDDEENPIRMRLRQRRYSSLTPPNNGGTDKNRGGIIGASQRSRSQIGGGKRYGDDCGGGDDDANDAAIGNGRRMGGGGWNCSQSVQNLPYHTSRHHNNRYGTSNNGGNHHQQQYMSPLSIGAEPGFWHQNAEEDWNRDEEIAGWEGGGGYQLKRGGGRVPNGYLSDQEHEWELERRRREREQQQHHHRRREHRHHRMGGGGGGEQQQQQHRHRHHQQQQQQRRPQSATALRNIAEWEIRHAGNKNDSGNGTHHQQQQQHQQHAGASSSDYYEQIGAYNGNNGHRHQQQQQHNNNNRRTTRQQELREQEIAGGSGYGSDASVETLSVNSAQSMQNRAIQRQQQQQQQQMNSSMNEEENELLFHGGGGQMMPSSLDDEEAQQQLLMMRGGQPMSAKEMKERKKSLMTRLIPGRNGPNDGSKRLGFARSEEVGIPTDALAPPEQNREFIKQNSKESTDSSDNWLPILPDRPLGSFMDNLGPGQVVGRQALGSSPLGELLVGLSVEPNNGLVVDVKEARALKPPGPKGMPPAIYVKAYLMEGKNCVAKAKTQPAKSRSASPMFRQKLVFAENARHKMLQLTVIGDFGRMERKAFLGVAQIALDELQLGREQCSGWFKLFHSASLNGSAAPPLAGGGNGTATTTANGNGANNAGEQPTRKDSEMSLT